MLTNFRIVLVNTTHPGNIGAAARAMKTMGLTNLYLVSPHTFPHPKAYEMASGANDVLDRAIIVETLDEAIADCSLVAGTSARTRNIPWPQLTPREFSEKAMGEVGHSIAVVFGQEQSGLTNEELQSCHFHISIPSSPIYSSLNLASAVQVICYEIYTAASAPHASVPAWDQPYANQQQMASFYKHLEQVLVKLDFLNPLAPRQLMPRLKRLFNRARLDVMELNILQGILGTMAKFKKGPND